jgi:ABC-2 type transport system ATP-binding protein
MAAGRILAIGEPAAIKREARSGDIPAPTIEDAFIALIEAPEQKDARR